MRVRQPKPASSLHCLGRLRALSGRRPTSSAITWRSRWICFWRAMWLTARLEYWMSFCRLVTCHIVAGSLPVRVPDVDREHERVLPRVVVEHRLDRGVRQDAAIPVELAVDAHGREGRRQRARGHHVADVERHVAAVEVAHLAGADIGGPDGQPGVACG